MPYVRTFAGAAALILLTAGAASALTITNKNAEEITFGLDEGATESVHKVAPGQSLTLKSECQEGCGLTGPWGYSQMANSGETYVTEGKTLTLQE